MKISKSIIFSLLSFFVLGACSNPDQSTDELSELFQDPPSEFRPLIITHTSMVQDNSLLDWLDECRAGGTVLDVAIRSQGPEGEEMWLNPDYMKDPELFDQLRMTMAELKKRGRQIWIYDEAGYPSGSAAGRVLEGHPEYEVQALSCRTFSPEDGAITVTVGHHKISSCLALPLQKGVASMEDGIDLTERANSGSFTWKVPEGDWIICLYEHYHPDTWKRHNARRRNVNIMDKEAIARFIEITHERYAQELGSQLQDVELFFTDEPQFGVTEPWIYGKELASPAVQWCNELPAAFEAKKGYPINKAIPALFLNVGSETSRYRYDFYDVQSDLVAENYFGQLQDWCHEHGVWSSGHMLLEESLLHHLMWTGSFMKNWSRMDLPGVDLLLADPSKVDPDMAKKSLPGDDPRYKTMGGWHDESVIVNEDFSCKMAASVAHLTGKQGVFTESFALSQNATLPRVKGVAAWQYATGITHMSTYSVQRRLSSEEYASFSDFAGRLALLCRRGQAVTDVAVLVPEASVWASYNPPDGGMFPHYIRNNPDAVHIDHVFRETCHQLSASQRDYEILSEDLLRQADILDGSLQLAGQSFSFLVLPEVRMMHESTLEKVKKFLDQGGHVAFVGSLPNQNPALGLDASLTLEAEALISSREGQVYHAADLKDMTELIAWMGDEVTPVLQWKGDPGLRMLHRRENERDIFLLANPGLTDAPGELSIQIGGQASKWNAEDGNIEPIGKLKPGEAIQLLVPAESARFVVIEK
jgi:hypothetical protein